MSILHASVTTVQIGPVALEGLMNENGDFAIAVPQFADIIQTSRNTASRDLKRLMGEGSKTSIAFEKWATPFNKRGVNVLTIADFERVLFEYAINGNAAAIALTRALVGLSLHQVFADAFGLKFEKEDRQRWLSERLESKHNFRPLTDQLKLHGMTDKCDYARFVWAMQTKVGIASGERDAVPAANLSRLNVVQTRLMTLMECGVSPWDALKRI